MQITVIIPVYNRAAMLVEALRSVLQQTCRSLQVIVVDDGSTDRPEAALQELADDKRVEFCQIGHTGMAGAARNFGLGKAKGDWISLLDSDDLWLPEKLEKQLATAADHAVLVHTRERWRRDGRDVSQRGQKHQRQGDVFVDALKKCIIGPSTVLLPARRLEELGSCLGGKIFREDLPVAEDYELWLHWTGRWPVAYVDEPLVEKRAGHGGQLSERWGVIEYFRLRALMDFLGVHESLPALEGLPVLPPNTLRFFAGLDEKKRQAAAAALRQKLAVFAAGAAKRGNTEVADWLAALPAIKA